MSIPTGTRQLTILWSVQGAGNHTKFTINRCRSLLEGLLIIGELEGSHCHRVGYFSFKLRSFLALWYAMSTSDHCKPFLRGRMKSYQNTMSVGLNIRNYQVCGVFHSSSRFFFLGGRVTIPGRLVTGGNHWQPGQQIQNTVYLVLPQIRHWKSHPFLDVSTIICHVVNAHFWGIYNLQPPATNLAGRCLR